MLCFHRVEQLEAVEPAALQPDVEIHQAGPSARNMGQRVVAIARRACDIAFVLQDTGDQFPDICFVVDNQDVIGHGLTVRRKLRGLSLRRAFRLLRARGFCGKAQPQPGPTLAGNLIGGIAKLDASAVLLQDPAHDR